MIIGVGIIQQSGTSHLIEQFALQHTLDSSLPHLILEGKSSKTIFGCNFLVSFDEHIH